MKQFLAIVLLSANTAWCAVTVDSVVTVAQYNLASTTATWSHTVAGSNNLLAVFITARTLGASNWSVSINGTIATQAVDADTANGSCAKIWYQNNPAPGVYTILIRSNGITARGRAASISYNGVDTASPTGLTATAWGGATNPSCSVATTAGQLVIDVATARVNGATLAVGAGQTERFNLPFTGSPTNQYGTGAGSDETAAGASTTMTWTAAGHDDWAQALLALNPATTGQYMTPGRMRYW